MCWLELRSGKKLLIKFASLIVGIGTLKFVRDRPPQRLMFLPMTACNRQNHVVGHSDANGDRTGGSCVLLPSGSSLELSPIPPGTLAASIMPSTVSSDVTTTSTTTTSVQEWEANIMDSVSRMKISSDAIPSCTRAQDECATATEVSFSADDLADIAVETQENVVQQRSPPIKSTPVRKRNKRKSSPTTRRSSSLLATPIRRHAIADATTPQISNIQPRRHKKARTLNPPPSSPLPLYLRQPCFSPCTTPYDFSVARLREGDATAVVPTDSSEEDTPPYVVLDDALSKRVSPIFPAATGDVKIDWIHPLPSFQLKPDRRRKRLLRMRTVKPPFPFFPLSPSR